MRRAPVKECSSRRHYHTWERARTSSSGRPFYGGSADSQPVWRSAFLVRERDLAAALDLFADHAELEAADLGALHGHDHLHVAVRFERRPRQRDFLHEGLLL